MYFLIKDDEFLEKYNKICKSSEYHKKVLNSEPVYNEKNLKAKIKSNNGKINTHFHNNKIPNKDSQYICLSAILFDFVFKTSKNYYPQVFLEECKHVVKEKKATKYIIDDIQMSFEFDEENSDEEN